MANSLAQKPQQKLTFSNYITSDGVKKKINEMVGGKDGQRFITSIISAVSINPALAECDQGSILSCAMLGESLKLSPSPQLGHYYMVPYENKKQDCKVAQFQLGYKGYIQLAIRSGQYKKINVLAIKDGELVSYNPLEEEITVNLIEDEIAREEAETIGYYAMFEFHNGFKKAMYWSKAKMLSHADKYSQAFSKDGCTIKIKGNQKKKVSFTDYESGKYDKSDSWLYSSFWYKDFDGMAFKTMLRQLISKWGIMSIEMQTAIEKDMGVINDNGDVEYVDNTPADESTIIIDGDNTAPEESKSEEVSVQDDISEIQEQLAGNNPFED